MAQIFHSVAKTTIPVLGSTWVWGIVDQIIGEAQMAQSLEPTEIPLDDETGGVMPLEVETGGPGEMNGGAPMRSRPNTYRLPW